MEDWQMCWFVILAFLLGGITSGISRPSVEECYLISDLARVRTKEKQDAFEESKE